MKSILLSAALGALMCACAGCASSSGSGGEVLSGVLMGIGQGLSGL